ncbi:PLP-dependent aminotransferase family protein [Flexivirga sp. ID2601S]|uniref:PLP-dependent aminotransferase family protein n=1 Tax=Flexivirga aerilata TaxID=1656889 RepID=A0A849AHI8_9MICO|nr:PLP-dependent aminotransferase family protein [Flexivirga aerilata]NNG39915.1 PLP-dependent aminotransferase family protein [Flexivirga aerilata]
MAPTLSAHRLASMVGSPADDGPAYRWLADTIRVLVSDGRLVHDTRLPSERDLVSALGLSRTTVTRAYGLLRDQGYAQARHGSGTRVVVPGGPVAGGGEPMPSALGALSAPPAGAIDLTCAAPPAAPGLTTAYADSAPRLAGYTSGAGYFPLGVPELREAVAERFTARGVPTAADQIIVTTGALAALATVFRALVGRGDRVVIENPTYPNSLATLRHSGGRPVAVPVLGDVDGMSGLRSTLASAKAMLVVPDFHNPTGRLLDDAARARLAGEWRRAGVVGVVDETIAELWLDGTPDVLPMAAHSPDCVTVGTASKTLWGGLRVGWIRAPHKLIGAIATARLTLDLGGPVQEQLVTASMIREHGGLPEDAARSIREARDAVLGLRDLLPEWSVTVPRGGLLLCGDCPSPARRRWRERRRPGECAWCRARPSRSTATASRRSSARPTPCVPTSCATPCRGSLPPGTTCVVNGFNQAGTTFGALTNV